MITIGIDLAAQAKDTAAFEIRWHSTHAEPIGWHARLSDEEILTLVRKADKVGIDVPLGWPTAFVRAVYRHQFQRPWPVAKTAVLRLRATDRFVARVTKIWPLSVSADRIGVAAARAAMLFSKLQEPLDRSGNGKLVEVYPAAALRMWGFRWRGYKGAKGTAVRHDLVREWHQQTVAW